MPILTNRRKKYYQMNEKQFEEIRTFYKTLGYSDEQTEQLCKSCFGADIDVVPGIEYSDSWRFNLRYRRDPVDDDRAPGGLKGFFQNLAPGKNAKASGLRKARGGMPADGMMMSAARCVPMEDACAMVEPEPIEACMPAPLMEEEPEFNTVETNSKPENEIHSPLDKAQLIFSANVNTASWTYLRSRINRGRSIDSDLVRVEEIVNSYSYKLDAPKDDSLFSVSTEHCKCPWQSDSELMFLGFKGMKADKNIRRNLAMLVDVSGSMDDEWVLVQMSMASIMAQLREGDILSIIAYSDDTRTVVKKLHCGSRDELVKAILKIDGIGGCTNGSKGLEDAYTYLSDNFREEDINRVFIFTDGDFNFGITSEGGLEKYIYKKRETGIYLSIVGYGENNFKDNKMEALARNGNGNYTFVSSPGDILDCLSDKLLSSMVTIAKDVKISVELNPAYVSEYRLIGYNARMLTRQEFHDTEKAVDGIGSEHNVVALVEFKRGKAEQKYQSRYVKVSSGEANDEFAFIEVHYKSPDGENLVMTRSITVDELNSSPEDNADTAAMLAAFGLLLSKSKYSGSLTKDMLKELLESELKKHPDTEPLPYSHYAVIQKYLS
ncbi:MAG: von Willebrand factor type A domain-containing protein [Clostridia bacterium]|nr:von Willebrand factor type A domain-containing protein [Clostridia bacterium]